MAQGGSRDGGTVSVPEQLFRRRWQFVLGVPSLEVLPEADRPEVAFAGRSNVGKSSLINALVGERGLARTSNTPGRTQELNYFEPTNTPARLYLVDMPGYGYAEAPKEKVDAWTGLVKDYLRGRVTLKRVMLLIDARHGVKAVDAEIMAMLDETAVSYQVVLTKADKVKRTALAAVIDKVEEQLRGGHPAAFPGIIATSSETGEGIDALKEAIADAAGVSEA